MKSSVVKSEANSMRIAQRVKHVKIITQMK